MGKISLAATILFSALGIILISFGVRGVTMPQPYFIAIVTIMSLIAIAAISFLSRAGVKAIGSTEWQKRRVYKILGVPKSIPIGEQQISIALQLGATCYIGSCNVYLVKEKGLGILVPNDLGWVALNKEKTDYSPGIRGKGEVLQFFLEFHTKAQWKGWLKIGFNTESGTIPYVHFPITFQ